MRVPRIVSEALGAGLAGLAGGAVAYTACGAFPSCGLSIPYSPLYTFAGVALGAGLGAYLGGWLLWGDGSLLWTLVGAGVGTAVALAPTFLLTPPPPIVVVLWVAGPIIGAVAGYEMTSSDIRVDAATAAIPERGGGRAPAVLLRVAFP